ncbi:MAG TPA: sulfatase-like hydrolase/transferase [Pirellulales bacterium]|nr:sulfatase-like hydrolase/transferase [Pirellulales bacterium]
MNAIILAVDRLHARYLGCYGNTWIATPEFNRLAAESFLFEQALIDTPHLAEIYDSFWLGSHVLERRGSRASAGPSLAELLGQAGVATTLISDEPEISRHALAGQFGEVIRLDEAEQAGAVPASCAADAAETRLAGFFAVASDWLASAREPFCLWLHAQSLGAVWDAPLEFRRQYADEDEPAPPDFASVPSRELPADFDPDELLGICQAYAGQASVLDSSLGGFLEAVRGSPNAAETLLAVTSTRGFPLGEHRRIGAANEALYGELVHAAWLLRLPNATGAMDRSQALVQPPDLFATLVDWWGIARPAPPAFGQSLLPLVRGERETLRDRACLARGDGQRAIRTPAWYLRLPAPTADAAQPPRAELFAKPDDRWEVNDVADRCAETAEALQLALADFESAAQAGAIDQLAPLEESLVDEFR